MARPIKGTLYVSSFISTGNVGEYTFENAIFNNQADATGNAAYDTKVGAVIYVQATDANTGVQLPGVSHRYAITAITVIDAQTVSGTVIWDEAGPEVDSITNGVTVIYTEKTPKRGFGLVPSDTIYSDLPAGSTIGALASDELSIFDNVVPDVISYFENDKNYQTGQQVSEAIQAIVGMAPEDLNTLKEFADRVVADEGSMASLAITVGQKANSTDMAAALDLKADKTTVNSALALKADTETVNSELAMKADISSVNTALALKSDANTVNSALALKANATDVDAALAQKASKTELANEVSMLETTLSTHAQDNAISLASKADKITVAATVQTLNDAIALKAVASDVNAALALKADTTAVNSALALKADKTELADDISVLNDAIALKASTTTVNDALALKADTTTVNSELALKASKLELAAEVQTLNDALALKGDSTAVNDALALKANITDVTSALALKASHLEMAAEVQTLNDAIALKASTTTVNAALALKANTSDVDSALALKADATTVNDALALKAVASDVTSSLALKANTADVNAALALKADTTAVNDALALKVDNSVLADEIQVLNDAIALKATTTVVNDALALKSDTSTVNAALALKTNDADLAAVAKSGSYADLSNTPFIPSKVSDIANDTGFLSVIPVASPTVLGGVKIAADSGLSVDAQGNLVAPPSTTELYNNTARYQVSTITGQVATLVSTATVRCALSWTRSTTTLTIKRVAHGHSVGDRVIVRNTNLNYQVSLITAVSDVDHFTIGTTDIGATSGSMAAYLLGLTFSNNNGAGSITAGTVVAPAGGDVQLLSLRIHLAANTRSGTTYSLAVPTGLFNGTGGDTSMDDVFVPIQQVRQDGATLSAVGNTIATNILGSYSTFQFAALPASTTGIHILMSF